jgi:NAD(P)-dependent dehydrogenase (short-subunit alcohol dehydrogenase family)
VSKNLFDLSGKVAIVTGASRGLGKSMARALAQAGAERADPARGWGDLNGRDPGHRGVRALACLPEGTPPR